MKKLTTYILILFSLSLQAQVFEWKNPTIDFEEFKVKFEGLSVSANPEDSSRIEKERVELFLELGETTQGIFIKIIDCELKNVSIEQKYETSLSISNEGPHLDLLKWKHYSSGWKKLISNSENKFKTQSYNTEQEEMFPDFTETELIEYLIKIGYPSYAKLIEKPIYEGGSNHWWIGLSKVSFRIKGNDLNGKIIKKQIDFEIPMGC